MWIQHLGITQKIMFGPKKIAYIVWPQLANMYNCNIV